VCTVDQCSRALPPLPHRLRRQDSEETGAPNRTQGPSDRAATCSLPDEPAADCAAKRPATIGDERKVSPSNSHRQTLTVNSQAKGSRSKLVARCIDATIFVNSGG